MPALAFPSSLYVPTGEAINIYAITMCPRERAEHMCIRMSTCPYAYTKMSFFIFLFVASCFCGNNSTPPRHTQIYVGHRRRPSPTAIADGHLSCAASRRAGTPTSPPRQELSRFPRVRGTYVAITNMLP